MAGNFQGGLVTSNGLSFANCRIKICNINEMTSKETKKRKRVIDSDDVSDEDDFVQKSDGEDEEVIEEDEIEEVPKKVKKNGTLKKEKSTSSLSKSSEVVIHDGKLIPRAKIYISVIKIYGSILWLYRFINHIRGRDQFK